GLRLSSPVVAGFQVSTGGRIWVSTEVRFGSPSPIPLLAIVVRDHGRVLLTPLTHPLSHALKERRPLTSRHDVHAGTAALRDQREGEAAKPDRRRRSPKLAMNVDSSSGIYSGAVFELPQELDPRILVDDIALRQTAVGEPVDPVPPGE
ncbi:MAG: hypothetical protein K2R93_19930, partial [Gemmatimonadaceae bacterium]|nr:hypothetical protein [Gemmatimonadaceae bacterium]